MTLRDKMLAVIADTNDSVAEREELVEMIAIALLTRKNLFVLGEPGQAKSYAINLFRRHITGARQFERLLSKQSDEEQLFGRVDLASLLPGSVPPTVLEQDATYQNQRFNLRVLVEGIGSMKDEPATWEKLKSGTEKLELYRAALSALHKSEPTVQTAGKIPEADIVLLDEIFKCNDGVLNSLLTALNERKYTNEGRTYPIPVISFFAASNEIPNFNDPQEKILEALYDRLELKVVTANMEDRGTRLAVLKNKQTGAFGQISATITLEELRQMQQEVASILVPDAINELADDILCELRKDMAVSDRKYLGYYPIAQAKAWLSGHDKVESCDLLALKNYLWRLPSDREKVEAVLTRLCVNPMQDKVNNIRGMALESQEEFDAALGDGSKADTVRKAFIKLRGELTHLYQMQCSLRTAAQSDSETALVDDLLADLEKISRKAHEQTHFTYTTLEEIAALTGQHIPGSIGHAKDTGRGNRKSCNRTDNNRIPEGSRHIDISLTHRVIRRCSRCRNCRRSHTGFVGKYTSCHTITHCIHHGSDNRSAQTAAYRFYRKCHLKNHQNACRQIRNISDNDNNATDHIKNRHQRNDHRRNL